MNETFTCVLCLAAKPVLKNGGTGYAIRIFDAAKICYACCADEDRKFMGAEGKISLYLTYNNSNGVKRYEIANWCGTLRYPAYITAEHIEYAFNRYRMQATYFRFTDHLGKVWYGKNKGDMQLARCRRCK